MSTPVYDNPQEYRPTPVLKRIKDNQIHWKRRAEILKKHPEIKQLYGTDPMTGFWAVAIVTFLYFLAMGISEFSKSIHAKENPYLFIFGIFALAYCIGAVLAHALWVLIHDLGHNMAFESEALNSLFLLIANLPHLVPSAVNFKFYHKLHHVNLNETYSDPDMPYAWEAQVFGNTTLGKMSWLSVFSVMQTLRTLRGPFPSITFELILNYIFSFGFNTIFVYYYGKYALFFLVLCGFFAIGLHPLGARWIAEHFAVHPDQETYSYYGFINKLAFNIGYHNEHHDFPESVPWSRLPLLTEKAKDFYEPLYVHNSYFGLLWSFFMDSRFTLLSRVVRDDKKTKDEEGDELISHKRD